MDQQFFYKTVKSISINGDYGFGKYSIESLPIIVPRIIWPDKGLILDTEQIIERDVFHVKLYDGSLTPLTQFYAEGGIIGVALGFFVLGLFLSWIYKICFSNNSLIGIIGWVIILSSIIQLEENIPVQLLLGIRNSIVIILPILIMNLRRYRKNEKV